jgi:hypothetical protein
VSVERANPFQLIVNQATTKSARSLSVSVCLSRTFSDGRSSILVFGDRRSDRQARTSSPKSRTQAKSSSESFPTCSRGWRSRISVSAELRDTLRFPRAVFGPVERRAFCGWPESCARTLVVFPGLRVLRRELKLIRKNLRRLNGLPSRRPGVSATQYSRDKPAPLPGSSVVPVLGAEKRIAVSSGGVRHRPEWSCYLKDFILGFFVCAVGDSESCANTFPRIRRILKLPEMMPTNSQSPPETPQLSSSADRDVRPAAPAEAPGCFPMFPRS